MTLALIANILAKSFDGAASSQIFDFVFFDEADDDAGTDADADADADIAPLRDFSGDCLCFFTDFIVDSFSSLPYLPSMSPKRFFQPPMLYLRLLILAFFYVQICFFPCF